MALEGWDGFDQYPSGTSAQIVSAMAQGGWALSGNNFSFVTGPDGTAKWLSINNSAGNATARRAFAAPLNAGRFGGYVAPSALDGWAMTFFDGVNNTAQCSIRGTADGRIQAYRGTGTGSPLGSASPVCMAVGEARHVEAYALISDTVGVIQVWVENVLVLNLSGLDTKQHASSTTFSALQFECPLSNAFLSVKHIFWANPSGSYNTGQIGPRKVRRLAVNGDGAPMNYAASSGTDRYAMVDEDALDTADYITSTTIGDKARFAKPNLAVTPVSIAAVGIRRFSWKSDAGACNDRSALVIGGTEYNAAARTLTTGGEHLLDVWEVDPSDSGAWTKAKVDAASPQIERTL